MAIADYETVLRTAQHLTPDERRRLIEALAAESDLGSDTPQSQNHAQPLTDEERQATVAALEKIDRIAVRIGKAWQSDLSAADAVKEQRREL